MPKQMILSVLLLLSISVSSQHLLPTKLENCSLEQFCLDCGQPYANPDPALLKRIAYILNARYTFTAEKGRMAFQILVDTTGRGCVLSHSASPKNEIAMEIVSYLNAGDWQPARSNGKLAASSIIVVFDISDGKLSGSVSRIPPRPPSQNMSNPGEPVIYNKKYKYSNESLDKYQITVWQNNNSKLPHDMSVTSAVDKAGQLWYATYYGFVVIKNDSIRLLDKNNSPFVTGQRVSSICIDEMDNKWVSVMEGLFRNNNSSWQKIDKEKSTFGGVYNIVPTKDSAVLFCTDSGLIIYKNEKWTTINTTVIPQLPSNRVYYAYKDSKGRLWIGTFGGSIMIDENKQVTEFNKTKSFMNNICLTKVTEDPDGNLYFGLYAYDSKGKRNKEEEGFAIYTNNGKWEHFNDRNSGLPSNTVNSILYDRFENILWIATNESGLVRFDLKEGFEVYHNKNSKVPSSYIFSLSQDKEGTIYASTFNGVLKLSRISH